MTKFSDSYWPSNTGRLALKFNCQLTLKTIPLRFASFNENRRQFKPSQNALRNFHKLCPPVACNMSVPTCTTFDL